MRYRGKRETKVCQNCKQKFQALSIKVRAGKARFCSRGCYDVFRRVQKQDKFLMEKKHQLKYKYGLSLNDYYELIKQQSNLCKICDEEFNGTPFVDHCHLSGKVRGLLCNNCNTGLGLFKDSATLLERAKQYLQTVR